MASISPATQKWWYDFVEINGRDSEEESAFLGRLATRGIDPHAGVPELDAAYAEFCQWWDLSRQPETVRQAAAPVRSAGSPERPPGRRG